MTSSDVPSETPLETEAATLGDSLSVEHSSTLFAEEIANRGERVKDVEILISFDVVRLLSEQLYASPVKAIEELVVNGWDAGADNASVLIDLDDRRVIAVFDDGAGMSLEQLSDLWHIGVSHKPPLERPRKQIGKFGIGKLASYAVARRATYVTNSVDGLLAVTINFDDLASRTDKTTGIAKPLQLEIRRLDLDELRDIDAFKAAEGVLDTESGRLAIDSDSTWTLVILEQFRDRAKALVSTGRLRWVLETAMPRSSDFNLYLNGAAVSSVKAQYDKLVSFDIADIEPKRLQDLARNGPLETWTRQNDALVSPRFPNGVRGEVIVTRQSLYKAGGKSEDLGRSHGFFVRVHGRLVNETDPLFGARPLSFSTWYHFAADLEASDLNEFITAARDDFEQSDLKPILRNLLVSLFSQARDKKEELERDKQRAEREKKESEREYVSRRIVEQPLADALILTSQDRTEGEAESRWSLVEPIDDVSDLEKLVSDLYSDEGKRRSYTYRYGALGDNEPFIHLDARTSVITLNEDHVLTQEFGDKTDGRRLLELFATAEAMLEAYLHEAGVAHEQVREILARRDLLLRSLAQDEAQSLTTLARAVREAALLSDDSKGFEIAIIGALRALGFAAVHISGSGTPDGIADYQVFGAEGKKITLEAKASRNTPSLGQLDMSGIRSHAVHNGAAGTLVVAPTYPGIADPDSEVNRRAVLEQASCWTADQLAQVVEVAEARHITAKDVQNIILSTYRTVDVAAAVDALVRTPGFSKQELYIAILDALEGLAERLKDRPRTVDMVAAEVSRDNAMREVGGADILRASHDLAAVSRGLLHVTSDEHLVLLGDLAELRRRTTELTATDAEPRRRGNFRAREA